MKIAYLSTFYPYRGGIAQFNASLLNALARKHEVQAYTFTLQYPRVLFPGKTQYVTAGDNATAVDAKRVLSSVNPISYITAARTIRRFAPDVLLMKYWMSFLGPSLGYVAGHVGRDAKAIAVLDNVIPHEPRFFDKPLTKYFLNRCNGFVVMSDAVKNDLLTLKPDACYVCQPHPLYDHFGTAIDKAEARARLGLQPNLRTLLFFGLIRDYKGLDLLIDAYSKLGEGYQLLIAGEPYGDFEKYRAQIAALPRANAVHTEARYIGDDEVPLFFSAADVCILPYRSATQSGITSIAYHFNLPIVATDVGGLKETVVDGETGVVVGLPTSDAIAEGIAKFFAHPLDHYAAHIAALRQRLSWEAFAESMVHFCTNL